MPAPVTVTDGGQAMTGGWLSVTVTVSVQRRVLPAASVAWNTTLLVPTGNEEPLGKPVTRTATPLVGAQLSVNAGAVYATAVEHPFDGVFTLIAAGHVNDGACVSLTTTRNVQVAVRPPASVAFQVTVVMPLANVALLFGLPVTWPVPPLTHWGWPEGRAQLSEAVGVAYDTNAVHWPASVGRLMLPGHAIVGAWASVTVTVKEHDVLKPPASTARKDTVVEVPDENTIPLLGPAVCVAVAPPQLSVAVGVANETTAPQLFGSAWRAMFAGQAMEGNSLSTTVTVNVHGVAVKPTASDALRDIVVVPLEKEIGPLLLPSGRFVKFAGFPFALPENEADHVPPGQFSVIGSFNV